MERGKWTAVEMMPTLDVSDLDEAVAYYVALGFEELWRYPSDAEPTHVGMQLSALHIMLALWSRAADRIDRQNIYFVMKGVDSFHESLRPVLGDDLSPIAQSDYGMRDFSVKDPWGHLLTFGEEC